MTERFTAETCRQEAKEVASEIQDTNVMAHKAALAAVGSFWTDLGQLNLAMGDPDELVEVLAKRREQRLGSTWKMP